MSSHLDAVHDPSGASVPPPPGAPMVVIASEEWMTRAGAVARAFDEARSDTLTMMHVGAGAADLLARVDSIAGCVMLGWDRAAASTLRAKHGDVSLVVVSADPPPDPVTCWFAKVPSPAVLVNLFNGLVPASSMPTVYRPRRKTDAIVGNSASINTLLHACTRLALSPATVLVTGETGTGKELVARALHYCGPRASRPFIAINCAAIPDTMMEAELFGHQRGAFTGAVSARAGAFETAEGGTVFLDEIGEMPLAMQPKLLRVLDAGEVTRLGSSTPIASTSRVVAATNRDLEAEVAGGRFREDLYYRLGVHMLHVPPLRERPDDIPLIVKHHLSLISGREGAVTPRLTSPAIAKLLAHSWPGNVRELIATVERAALTAKDNVIEADDISFQRRSAPKSVVLPYRDAKSEFEKTYFANLIRAANGNISMAAALAKKTRKEIYDGLRRAGIQRITERGGTRRDRSPPEE